MPLMSEEIATAAAVATSTNKSHSSDPVEIRRMMYQTPGMASHPPIPVTMLAQHIEILKANDNLKFSQEYEVSFSDSAWPILAVLVTNYSMGVW